MARRGSSKGTGVGDLTPDVYFRAYRLFAANKTDNEIRRIIGLTRGQLNALYHDGLPAKKGREPPEALPPFTVRLAEEDAQLSQAAREINAEVSTRGVEALRGSLLNVQAANVLVSRILRQIQERITGAGDRKLTKKHMPTDAELQALSTLRLFADLGPVARAWQRIYARPGTAPTSITNNVLMNLPPGAEVNLPASIAVFRQMAGDDAKNQLVAAIAGEMASWSDDEIARYALTGAEPAPVVIDARDVNDASNDLDDEPAPAPA